MQYFNKYVTVAFVIAFFWEIIMIQGWQFFVYQESVSVPKNK